MLIKPPEEFKVPEEEPFRNDKLGRKEAAEALKDLLSNVDQPFVMAIDSSFGTGKTTFIKMFQQYLINEKFRCIYFNAWENDFVADPLAALIGTISINIGKLNEGEITENIKSKFEATKNVGKSLLKRAIPIGAKIITRGEVDLEKEYENELASLSGAIASDLIDGFQEQKDDMEKFKEALESFTKEYKVKGYEDKPVIFFIDELDRCRPNFALELLERIKHIFNVPGFVFIPVYDKTQLGSMIKTVYGQDIDIDGYLQRFVDIEYKLPKPAHENYISFLFEQYGLEKYFSERAGRTIGMDKSKLENSFAYLFKSFNLTLREQGHCFRYISVVANTTPTNFYIYPYLLAALISIKISNKVVYYRYIENIDNYEEMLEYVNMRLPDEEERIRRFKILLEAEIISIIKSKMKKDQYFKGVDFLHGDQNKDAPLKKKYEIWGAVTLLGRAGQVPNIEYIIKKLELLDRFHDFTPSEEKQEGGA